jgi:arsenate reductase-like glutaredoxin family protein
VKDPLSYAELAALAEEVGGVERLLSTRSPAYRKLQGTPPGDWLAVMADEPRLIRRPILITDRGVAVGFDAAWTSLLPER